MLEISSMNIMKQYKISGLLSWMQHRTSLHCVPLHDFCGDLGSAAFVGEDLDAGHHHVQRRDHSVRIAQILSDSVSFCQFPTATVG